MPDNLLIKLEAEQRRTESVFQRHLLGEDLIRIRKLVRLAGECETESEFLKQGFGVGWTAGDLHTFKIKGSLDAFLTTFYRCMNTNEAKDDEIETAWIEFNRDRMDKIVGCL